MHKRRIVLGIAVLPRYGVRQLGKYFSHGFDLVPKFADGKRKLRLYAESLLKHRPPL